MKKNGDEKKMIKASKFQKHQPKFISKVTQQKVDDFFLFILN